LYRIRAEQVRNDKNAFEYYSRFVDKYSDEAEKNIHEFIGKKKK
jgi:hypothetical protein